MQAAANALKTSDDATILWIDTLNSFSAERLLSLLPPDTDATTTLPRLRCIRAFNIWQLLSSLDDVLQEHQDGFFENLRIVVIDSVASCIIPILGATQVIGHALMSSVSRALNAIANERRVPVLVRVVCVVIQRC